jgi:hypothetical protein
MSRSAWKIFIEGRGLLHWLPYVVLAGCIGWMAYGFLTYPHAPITPCGINGFCDKRHGEHTLEEYERFRFWEMMLFLSWPFGMASGYVIQKRHRQSSRTEDQK